MRYKDEFDATMLLARKLSGEENVLENMEKEGQSDAIRRSYMPIEMYPSREVWESLGFEFTEIEDDDVLCSAKLPDGWSVRATSHSMHNDIIDANGNVRGNMFYKSAFYDRSGHMSLRCKYNVGQDISDDCRTIEIYFGNKNEKLFIAGTVTMEKDDTEEQRREKYFKQSELEKIAKDFADENYPDWQNVNAYWDSANDIGSEPHKK